MNYILLLIGFILLIKGADYFVEGASTIAKKLHVPTLIIGLTIVAFGTSAPEAAVSITAALQGSNDMAIANVVGSNIFNLLVVVGIAAIIYPLKVKRSIIAKEFPFALLACAALFILGFDTLFQGYRVNVISRGDAVMLLILFGIFMYYLIELALISRKSAEADNIEQNGSWGKSILFAIVGLVGIIIGGKWVVDAATGIALSWGMSESLVGLTIVAIGTSLPELVTSIVAARKGESDIALGNVIGSNIFNIFFVLGLSAIITPIGVTDVVFVDIIAMIIISIIAYIFAITKSSINKVEGSLLTTLYFIYMIYIIMR